MNGATDAQAYDDDALDRDFEDILTSVFATLDVAEPVPSPAAVPDDRDSEPRTPTSNTVGTEAASEKKDRERKERPYFKSVYIPLPKERFRFMSHTEISIVIRHSLQSLQTKNPMDDDFYYQVYTARQDGTPILPEGTLGRVTFGTFRQPRTLLQLSGSNRTIDDPRASFSKSSTESAVGGPRRFMFPRFSLHYLIEEGIRCIMDVEDVDNLLLSFPSTSVQEAVNQQMLNLQRVKLGKRLLEHLGINELVDANGVPIPQEIPLPPPDSNHIIFKYGNLAKGRNLILRSLMCLQPEQVYLIVHVMVARLALFVCPVDFTVFDRELGTVLEKHLEHWPPAQVIDLMALFLNSSSNLEHLFEIIRSVAGSVLVLVFCKVGHILRSHPTPVAANIASWFDVYRRLYAITAPSFEQVFPNVPTESCADPLTRWRILADMSSHAAPQELALVPRSGWLWELIERDAESCPPTAYFANLVLSIYREPPLHSSGSSQYSR